MSPPQLDDPAPNPALIGLDGKPLSLADIWATQPTVVSFLRYFGCPFCQAWVSRLVRHASDFDDLGVRVVLVGQESVGHAMGFTGPRRIPFTIAIDLDRSAYQAFGLVDGEATELLRPRIAAAWVGVHLRGEGRQGGLQGGNLAQLPGTFLVDTGGVLRFVYRNRHQADDPDVQHLLDACRAIAA